MKEKAYQSIVDFVKVLDSEVDRDTILKKITCLSSSRYSVIVTETRIAEA